MVGSDLFEHKANSQMEIITKIKVMEVGASRFSGKLVTSKNKKQQFRTGAIPQTLRTGGF
jgi:hypothetical protein